MWTPEVARQIQQAFAEAFPLPEVPAVAIEIGGFAARVKAATSELREIYLDGYERFFSDREPAIEIEVGRHDVLGEVWLAPMVREGPGSVSWVIWRDFCAEVNHDRKRVRALMRHDAPFFTADAMLRIAFSTLLLEEGLILVHSVSAAEGNRAALFMGPSESGKSTLARALRSDAAILADDVTAVRIGAGEVRTFGTPFWSLSEPDYDRNRFLRQNARLGLCASLVKSNHVALRPMKPEAAVGLLLQNNLYFGADATGRQKVFDLAMGLMGTVPFFELHFVKDASPWEAIREVLDRLEERGKDV
ncbi:MAG: hypothetical protein ACYTHM_02420 [Planctomycetota bacterium]|jgi:hypothetical protein